MTYSLDMHQSQSAYIFLFIYQDYFQLAKNLLDHKKTEICTFLSRLGKSKRLVNKLSFQKLYEIEQKKEFFILIHRRRKNVFLERFILMEKMIFKGV